jgi:hypothetical protein
VKIGFITDESQTMGVRIASANYVKAFRIDGTDSLTGRGRVCMAIDLGLKSTSIPKTICRKVTAI